MRLCNDCAYLAGETGLLAVGMREVGLRDLGEVLEQVSAEMDFCGVYWRERYLVRYNPLSVPLFCGYWRFVGHDGLMGWVG